jgi:hypothetical protein
VWKVRRKVATTVEKPQCVHFLPDQSAIRLIAPVWTHRRNKKKTVGPTLCHHHVSSDELATAAVSHRFIHYAPHPFTRRPSLCPRRVAFRYNSLIWNDARMHAITHAGRRLPERETHHQPMMTGHKRICRIEYEPNKSQQRKKPLAPGYHLPILWKFGRNLDRGHEALGEFPEASIMTGDVSTLFYVATNGHYNKREKCEGLKLSAENNGK